jgi:hypothetical protein
MSNTFQAWRGHRSLTASDWWLLAGAAAAQTAVWAALRVMTLSTLRSAATCLRRPLKFMLRGGDERVIWAVEATGRRLSGLSTCLVRAVVVETRCGSGERPVRLEIGVRRTPAGALQSHAWVRDGHRVIVGGPVEHDFVPIVAWDSAA